MHALVCPLCRIALPSTEQVCPRDGNAGREAPWLTVPPSLAQRFQVLEPFAHGESGSLYIVDEPETGRRGLLKVLAPVSKELLADRQRLRRELVKQATLTRTNLSVPYASGDADGFTWIFREWLDGVSLEVRLSREGSLQQTEALGIAAQVALALDELHRGGLLHRDVKPGHVFLQPTAHGIPRAVLLDAGVAGTTPMRGSVVHGTPGYLAPEQLLGSLVSFRSDLYALGAVLYRTLTGRPAFLGASAADVLEAQRAGEPPPFPPSLPPGIRSLLASLLSKDPQERPFSAQKLRRTLEPFLPGGALIEKHTTSSFELLPREQKPAATPSGTLRPPPPPAARVSATSEPLRAPYAQPSAVEDTTHQLDLTQVEAELAARSVPPPMPAAATETGPEPTQPIRLDQILAVNEGMRRTGNPPPAPAPEPAPRMAEPAPREEPLGPRGAVEHTSGADSAPHPTARSGDAVGRGTLQGLPSPSGRADHDSSEHTLEVPRGTPAAATAKATLLGIGIDPLAQPLPLETGGSIASIAEAPAARAERPDQPPDDAEVPKPGTPRERDIPTEPIPVTEGASSVLIEPSAAGATRDTRRILMYASAGLVGLGVLAVAASALLSSPAEQAAAGTAPPALPAVTRAAEAPEPLPPEVDETPAPEAPPTPPTRPPEAAPRAVAERATEGTTPKQRPIEPEKRPRRASSPRARRAEKPAPEKAAPKPAAKPAPAPAPKAPDRAALFAEARDEARAHYAAKRYKEAAAAYERAARHDPGHAGTFAGLGAARLQLGNVSGAVQAYQRAVQLSPDTAGLHAALGRAYLTAGDEAKARAAYKRALALDPKNAAAKAALQKL